jgi:hypothetical protein
VSTASGTSPADLLRKDPWAPSVPPWTSRGIAWFASGLGVALTALGAGLFFARRALDSYDAQIMFTVAKSIVTTGTAYVPRSADGFGLSSPHSSYGLGQSLLEAPAYLLAVNTGHRPETLAMLVNPVVFAAVAVAVWAWARTAGATAGMAAATAAATSFGTLLLAYTTTGGSELGTALGIAIAILGVELTANRPMTGAVVAAAGVTVAVLMRPDSALLVAIPVAVAVLLRTRRGVPLFVLGVVPVAIVTLVYNLSHGAQYQGITWSQTFSHPLGAGVYGLLLSPSRGLLLYVPLVLPALVAIPWAWRRSPVVTGVCLALLAIRVLFYAKWFAWHGGWAWGPRFLVPAMPALAPLVLEIVRRLSWRRPTRAVATTAVVGVMALSILVQVLGVAVRYDTDRVNTALSSVTRWDYSGRDALLSDWRYFPILEHARELRHGRNLARGYAGGVGGQS